MSFRSSIISIKYCFDQLLFRSSVILIKCRSINCRLINIGSRSQRSRKTKKTLRHFKHLCHLSSDTLQTSTTLLSTPTQFQIFGNVPQCPHHKTKQRPQHWHKLPIHITSITHCKNIRKNTIISPSLLFREQWID